MNNECGRPRRRADVFARAAEDLFCKKQKFLFFDAVRHSTCWRIAAVACRRAGNCVGCARSGVARRRRVRCSGRTSMRLLVDACGATRRPRHRITSRKNDGATVCSPPLRVAAALLCSRDQSRQGSKRPYADVCCAAA